MLSFNFVVHCMNYHIMLLFTLCATYFRFPFVMFVFSGAPFPYFKIFLQLQRNSIYILHTLGIRLLTSNVVKFRLSKSKINKNYLHSIPMGSIFTIKK